MTAIRTRSGDCCGHHRIRCLLSHRPCTFPKVRHLADAIPPATAALIAADVLRDPSPPTSSETHHASAHPLDGDLLDYVEGTLPDSESRSIDEHLAGCILCRIKRQRLANVPPLDLTGVQDLTLPTFTPIRSEPLDGSEAVRGDLWVTASEDSAIVLIRSVRENAWGIVVVPVILDVEVADSGALVLDETASPLDTPIAIYERMTISLPLSALAARIVPVRAGIDLWALAAGDPGVTRGSGLQGATDPRIELRQYLADRLVALDPHMAGPT